MNHTALVSAFMERTAAKNPGEKEFLQAVLEFAEVIVPFVEEHPVYKKAKILERMVEPERVVIFRVPWLDDKGEIQVNRGFRIQMNSAIGPYKGGLRFHPSVNLSILKFLAFEQVFKNSLTTLPLGGGKGGSDFDPKGKSDNEVMKFCQSFMTELCRHIGQFTDVPAGDIGVGAREIGFLFGQYKKVTNEFTGVLTGKSLNYGGSLIRPEATGYGCVYFSDEALRHHGHEIAGKTALVSGSGNVAQFTTEKLIELGAKVVTVSDSSGFVYDKAGIDAEKLDFIKDLKNVRRGRIKEYADKFKAEFHEGKTPWGIKCDIAYPCATQNELDEDDAKTLVKNGVIGVFEGANMPTTPEAMHFLRQKDVLFSPGKASNAGGVGTSGLEMAQNSQRLSWTRDEVDYRLKIIMKSIHENCVNHGAGSKIVDYVKGANIAGFRKVADAMLQQGVV
ncbi:NADP-specific glutamate dehydrogenase [uncultured Imperialibacter sp.]|uniref:NADP-specific glutamate dehydrogenase n=1 Tax=uncultured Imperialibacter sp. TaxID=1672639 RepID=UPI0030DBEAFC|tara:strand:+ start:2322 stop:3665 length:1344 start_codon:yes stop_codon:yes gene_type:complete